MQSLVRAVRSNDLHAVKHVLAGEPKLARKLRVAVEAARAADLGVIKLLDREGADWNASWRGYRPLHALIQEKPVGESTAPSAGRLACLDFLLSRGADPEQVGAFPAMRALIAAAFTGIQPFVRILLSHGARTDPFTACALGDLERVRKTLRKDEFFVRARDAGGPTGLQCCAGSRLGRQDAATAKRLRKIASALLDAGADPNAATKSWGDTIDVQYLAIASGDRKMVELLFDRGADPNPALSSALWSGNLDLAGLATEHGAEPDDARHEGRPLLNDLIRWGQVKLAVWLLERGASPNIADRRGWTAVHQAASRGNVRLMEAIMSRGGDLNRKSKDGETPLEVANSMGRSGLVDMLRKHGVR